MSAQDVATIILGAIGSVAAIRLVTSKNVVHAALYLVLTLAMVAATYLLLAAEFVAWVQVLIYVGAIIVLVLFSLMLTKAPIGREALDNQARLPALLVGGGVLAGLVYLVQDAFGGKKIELHPVHTAQVGTALFRNYVLPFEVVSVLLLAALVGAVVLARKDDYPGQPPDRRSTIMRPRERVP
jgi:NADH-quinone oxidoreductase subunit J